MINLAAAAAFLLALHTLPSTPLRPWAVDRLGSKAYLGAFGLTSLGALVWLVMAFNAAPAAEPLWIVPGPWRYLGAIIMLLAFVMLVAGLSTPNPTALGSRPANPGKQSWRGINAVTRHPVLWAIGIWGLVHLLSKPDLAAALFFGALAVLAIGGAKLQELRKARELGEAWQAFASHTSFIPFAAILDGRAHLSLGEIGYWRIGAGIALWAIMLSAHSALFRVPAL
jgi:uncharacterized membrane protein